ncbi:acyltransferase [Enterobacter kobei]|nr:acyltransferase [Enterobacter kobei]
MREKNLLDGLTIFRFVAAFYVFVFHAYLRFKIEFPLWIEAIIRNGAVGMTFFFVLSGFVMAWTSRNGIKKDYFPSRIKRIIPAYYFMGLITIPFLDFNNTYKALSQIILFIFTAQSWYPITFFEWNFIGSWSVSTEMFFYLIFPLVFPLISRHPLLFVLVSFLISSMIVHIALNVGITKLLPDFYVGPIYRLPEFLFGVALGCTYSKGVRLGIYSIPLAIVAAYLLLFISPYENIGWMSNNYATVLSTGIIVYVLASVNFKKCLLTNTLLYLGKISYSFYLMQIPIIMLIMKYEKELSVLKHWEAWLLFFSANLCLASLSYHFVENGKFFSSLLRKKGEQS